MSSSTTAAELPNVIQQLLEKRKQHTEAISQIDQTLARVNAALRGTQAPATASKPPAAPAAQALIVKAKKPGLTRFAVSATDLVLKFIREKKTPTTKEINQHLLSQGRSVGAVSNALSVLTAAKKLKRTPLGKGMMGSTYSIA
jgi:FaeA-like protein